MNKKQLPNLRGALLEEVILKLLKSSGYTIITPNTPDPKIRQGKSGMDLQGRGMWHQVDALAQFDFSPAFMYPLRLIVEAKCYDPPKKIGISVGRNILGVLKDVSENFFTNQMHISRNKEQTNNDTNDTSDPDYLYNLKSYNYHAAIFSTSDYTIGLQKYCIAHQIYLIQYSHFGLLGRIIEMILSFNETDFRPEDTIKNIRKDLRDYLEEPFDLQTIRNHKMRDVFGTLRNDIGRIKSSYLGMIIGKYPVHLLSDKPLSPSLFTETDESLCIIRIENEDLWYLEPRNKSNKEKDNYRLEFTLPTVLKDILQEGESTLDLKQNHMRFIDVSGIIGGLRRQIRFRLDDKWITGLRNRSKRNI